MLRIREVLAERQFKHDEGMALYYEKPLSELLPDQGVHDPEDFYTEVDEQTEEAEELEGRKLGEVETVRPLGPAKKNSKARRAPLKLKRRVLKQ